VLGLLERLGSATPYDLKQAAQISTNNFWTLPHTQIYAECERLAGEGLLSEEREQSGRRRRIYSLTPTGRRALEQWRAEVSAELYELRDVGTLKLFFGADPRALAVEQLRAHRARLAEYEQLHDAIPKSPEGPRLALELGIGQERMFIRFWSRLIEGPADG
jgi:PadR family transcriptional regulator, regulatory protein AphA